MSMTSKKKPINEEKKWDINVTRSIPNNEEKKEFSNHDNTDATLSLKSVNNNSFTANSNSFNTIKAYQHYFINSNNLDAIETYQNYLTIIKDEVNKNIATTWLFTAPLTNMSVESEQYKKQLDKIFIYWRKVFSILDNFWLKIPSLEDTGMITHQECWQLSSHLNKFCDHINNEFGDQLYWLFYNGANRHNLLQSIGTNIYPYFLRTVSNIGNKNIKSQRDTWEKIIDRVTDTDSPQEKIDKFFKNFQDKFLSVIKVYDRKKFDNLYSIANDEYKEKISFFKKIDEFNQEFQNKLKLFILKESIEEQLLQIKIKQFFHYEENNLTSLLMPIITYLNQETEKTLNVAYSQIANMNDSINPNVSRNTIILNDDNDSGSDIESSSSSKVKGLTSIASINDKREQLLNKGLQVNIQSMAKKLSQIVEGLKTAWAEQDENDKDDKDYKDELARKLDQLEQLLSTFEKSSVLYSARFAVQCLIDKIKFVDRLREEILIQKQKTKINNMCSLDLTQRNHQKLLIKYVLYLLLKGKLKQEKVRKNVIIMMGKLLQPISYRSKPVENRKVLKQLKRNEVLQQMEKWNRSDKNSDAVFIALLIDAGKLTSCFDHHPKESFSTTETWLYAAYKVTDNEIKANKRRNQLSKETKASINKINNKYRNNNKLYVESTGGDISDTSSKLFQASNNSNNNELPQENNLVNKLIKSYNSRNNEIYLLQSNYLDMVKSKNLYSMKSTLKKAEEIDKSITSEVSPSIRVIQQKIKKFYQQWQEIYKQCENCIYRAKKLFDCGLIVSAYQYKALINNLLMEYQSLQPMFLSQLKKLICNEAIKEYNNQYIKKYILDGYSMEAQLSSLAEEFRYSDNEPELENCIKKKVRDYKLELHQTITCLFVPCLENTTTVGTFRHKKSSNLKLEINNEEKNICAIPDTIEKHKEENTKYFKAILSSIKNDWISTKIPTKEALRKLDGLQDSFGLRNNPDDAVKITDEGIDYYKHFKHRLKLVKEMERAETTYREKSTTKLFEQLQSYEAILGQLSNENIMAKRKLLLKKQLEQLKSTDHLADIDIYGQKAIMTYLCKCIISGFGNDKKSFSLMIFILSKLLYSPNVLKMKNKAGKPREKRKEMKKKINQYLRNIIKAYGYDEQYNKTKETNEKELIEILTNIAQDTSGVLKGVVPSFTRTYMRLEKAANLVQGKPNDYKLTLDNKGDIHDNQNELKLDNNSYDNNKRPNKLNSIDITISDENNNNTITPLLSPVSTNNSRHNHDQSIVNLDLSTNNPMGSRSPLQKCTLFAGNNNISNGKKVSSSKSNNTTLNCDI